MTPILAAILLCATAPANACQQGETYVFSGAVEDGFGPDLAVCVIGGEGEQDATVTVRWSGEGGDDSVSCRASECDGVMEYSRYTRPRFTIVTLAWSKDGMVQRLIQSLDAQGEAPEASVRHFWAPRSAGLGSTESFPVRTGACNLALMKMGEWLPTKPWSEPLLSREN